LTPVRVRSNKYINPFCKSMRSEGLSDQRAVKRIDAVFRRPMERAVCAVVARLLGGVQVARPEPFHPARQLLPLVR
jgi:hypothetical protein